MNYPQTDVLGVVTEILADPSLTFWCLCVTYLVKGLPFHGISMLWNEIKKQYFLHIKVFHNVFLA